MALNSKVAIEVEIKNIKKIADLKQSLKDLRKEQRNQEKESKSGRFQSKKSAKAYKERAKAIKENSKALRTLNKDMAGATAATKKSTKASGSLSKSFVKAAATIGIVVGAFRMVTRALSGIVSTFTEFEFVMAKVNAVSGATEKEFAGLTKTAEELGRSTFFTASQVGELMLNFSKLGFTAQEIQNAVRPTLDLATATGSDLARSATVAGAAIRGFNLDASETTRVVDVMAVTFASSAMDIEKWQTSMTKVAPIAKSAGFSIEDTAAMMSKLTDAGIEASIAGTSMRNILLKMQDPTSELSKSFGKTIHSLDELVPAMEQFVLEGGSMADVMEVVDIRQAAAFETLLMSADGLIDFRDELKNASGEGYRMAQMVGDTLQGSLLRAKSAMQGLSISIMKNFGDSIKDALNRLANWLNALAENEEKIKRLIRQVKLFTKGILALVIGLRPARALMALFAKDVAATGVAMTVTRGLTITLSAAMRTLKVAIASTGIGLLIIAVGELAARFMFAASEEEKLASIMDEHGRAIQGIIDEEKTLEKIKKDSENTDNKKLTIIDGLIKKYGEENTELEGQKKILLKLNKLSPEFFGHLRAGISDMEDLKDAAADYKKELVEIARVKAVTDSLAGAKVEVKTLEAQLETAIEMLSQAHDLNDKVKAQIKSDFWSTDFSESWAGLSQGFLNIFEGGKQGKTRKDISAAVDKIGVLRQELNEARHLVKTLEPMLEDIDLEKMLGLDLGGSGGGGNKGQEAADWATKLQVKLNEIKQMQLDGTIGLEDAAGKIIQANIDINRQEFATLSKSQKNGKLGVQLQSRYLDEKLKLTKLNISETLAIHESDYLDDMVLLQQQLLKKEITKAEFDERALQARKDFLDAEYDELLNAIGDREQLTAEEAKKLDANRQNANNVELQIIKTQTKEKERVLKQAFDDKVSALQLEESTTMMSKIEFDNRMLQLEAEYLKQRASLYSGNALELIDINNSILKNQIEVNKTQKEMMKDQVSAMGGVGSALTTLAGDNEELNAVKEAGNAISEAANIITAFSTLQENLATIAKIGHTGAVVADTVALGANATASGVATVMTEAETAANAIQIPFLGTKAVLKSGSSLPWPINLIAFAATIIMIKKIMKMFEKGGVIDDGKFARGGMVHGPSHAQGGVKFAVGGRVNELEGGEAVINKRSTAMFRNQLSEMNQAGGGVKFADGGLMSSPAFTESQFNATSQNNMIGSMEKQRRVVVVEADITDSQSTVSVIQANATF